CVFAPAGTIAFNRHGCPVFIAKNNFVRNWAVSKFFCHYMLNFNLHVNGQCLKNSTLVLLKFLFVELEYIYLAHICVLKACLGF
ncbi:TPA: hypothetical protein ACSP9S_002855, partial [Staphylococcus aureus]